MQNLLAEWQSLPRENLFQFWQDELGIKKALRSKQSGFREIQLNSEAETVLLRQSIGYGERRELFYTILFLNMNHQAVQSAVVNGPVELYLGFLASLPQIIKKEQPAPRAIQFLINLYREELHAYFTDIAQVLNAADCDYLLARTARKSLRQLLNKRQSELAKEHHDQHYGLINALQNAEKYPGIFGDKVQIMAQAITNIQQIVDKESSNPAETILETADLLFTAGLPEECLSLLLLLYNQQHSFGISWAQNDKQTLHRFSKLLNKALPIHVLLHCPLEAYPYSQEIYQLNFPSLLADEASLFYLEIYAALLANYESHPPYTILEIAQSERFRDYLGNNPFVAHLKNLDNLTEDDLLEMHRHAHEKISYLPHESFIIMEIIRWLERVKQISLSRDIANQMLHDYLQLFQWMPSPLFINNEIRKQLAFGTDEQQKAALEQILNLRNQYSHTELREMYKAKADFFVNNPVARQLLLGSFLGV